MQFSSYTPKGFRSSEAPSHRVPTKLSAFHYSDGVWNRGLPEYASTYDPGDSAHGKASRYEGWLFYQSTTVSGTGKQFTIDFAEWPSSANYYDAYNQSYRFEIQYYSMVDNKWYGGNKVENGWTILGSSQYPTQQHSNTSILLLSQYMYTASVSGSYRPLYGIYRGGKVDDLVAFGGTSSYPTVKETGQVLSTYNMYRDYLNSKDIPTAPWDQSQGHTSFMGVCANGLRYISNNGKWGRSLQYPSSGNMGVTSNWQGRSFSKATITSLDDGATPGNRKTFTITPNMIQTACGTLAGVTRFRLKILRSGGGSFNSYYYWLWGNAADEIPYTALDNPQVGLLDHTGDSRHLSDWPPRYDAKAQYRNGGGAVQDLQARYNPGGSSWTVF